MRLQFTFSHGRPFKVTLQIAKSQIGLKSTKIDSFPVFPHLRKKLFHYLIRHFISTNQFNINSVFFVLVLFQFFSYFFSQPKNVCCFCQSFQKNNITTCQFLHVITVVIILKQKTYHSTTIYRISLWMLDIQPPEDGPQ